MNTRYILPVLFLLAMATPTKAQYTINDTFANTTDCDTMTRGIFIIWWDNANNYSAQADVLLDTMLSYRNTCLNDMAMMDPPNPIDGYYYNVYLHTGSGFFSPNGWGNGQGTDANGYPFLTFPTGVLGDLVNTAHETFHIFQYNATSPGFAYSGDSQWYIEASANWFAAKMNPNNSRAFVEAEALRKVPHVPLWLSYGNYPVSYPSNWQRYVHQYGLALYLYYLTDVAGMPDSLITAGLYAGTSEMPQEYFYNQVGASQSRQHFIDYAGSMTDNFNFISPTQGNTAILEFNTYADLADDNQFTQTYTDNGSGGWYQPATTDITNAWSFNTYKLNNSITASYTFEIDADPLGTYGDSSYFQGQLVVKSATGVSFVNLIMSSAQQGSVTLNLTPDDYEVDFIIASMPEVFEDVNPSFQLFPYNMRIVKNGGVGVEELEQIPNQVVLHQNYPNPFNPTTTIAFSIPRSDLVSIKVYNIVGDEITTLINDELSIGNHSIKWDGSLQPSGVYFVQIESSGFVQTRKMVLLN